MGATLNPYLNFNGNAREAMTFYQQVLGGKLDVSTFDEFGGGGDGVMHAQLETPDGFTLMGSDTGPGMGDVTPGTNFSVSLSGDDEAAPGLLGQALRRGAHRRAVREADVGRRVRHAHRQVRHRLDGQHRCGRRRRGLTSAAAQRRAATAASSSSSASPVCTARRWRCGSASRSPTKPMSRAPAYECAVMLSAIECPGIDTG